MLRLHVVDEMDLKCTEWKKAHHSSDAPTQLSHKRADKLATDRRAVHVIATQAI